MSNEKIYNMAFAKVFSLLIAKAEKKGRTRAEVLEVTSWLTGYTTDAIESALATDLTYGDFFLGAPRPNPNRTLFTGVVCGVRVESVEEPLMREIRYLDKLVDELAKGKPMEKILRGKLCQTTKTKPAPAGVIPMPTASMNKKQSTIQKRSGPRQVLA
ncbi:MAG: DUF2200 domain-containing protein [Clostridia bacterium]|nr:DUF2200 domain-containing protein [Clostridia bacterium]